MVERSWFCGSSGLKGKRRKLFLIKIRFGLVVMKTLYEKPFIFRICVFLVLDVGVWCLVLCF